MKSQPEPELINVTDSEEDEGNADVVIEKIIERGHSGGNDEPKINRETMNVETLDDVVKRGTPEERDGMTNRRGDEVTRPGGYRANHDHSIHGEFPTIVPGLVRKGPEGCWRCTRMGHSYRECTYPRANDCCPLLW